VAALGFEGSFELAGLSLFAPAPSVVDNPDFGRKQLIACAATGDSQLIEILHPQPMRGNRHLRDRGIAGVPHVAVRIDSRPPQFNPEAKSAAARNSLS
jgi:hypothetical protein